QAPIKPRSTRSGRPAEPHIEDKPSNREAAKKRANPTGHQDHGIDAKKAVAHLRISTSSRSRRVPAQPHEFLAFAAGQTPVNAAALVAFGLLDLLPYRGLSQIKVAT
ncbi:MAG TPA: hypothetical protein VGD71_07665, partial [Kribbella sp.]